MLGMLLSSWGAHLTTLGDIPGSLSSCSRGTTGLQDLVSGLGSGLCCIVGGLVGSLLSTSTDGLRAEGHAGHRTSRGQSQTRKDTKDISSEYAWLAMVRESKGLVGAEVTRLLP